MIIQDLFLYFAKFPQKAGVKAIATMGSSEMPEYATLMAALDALPSESLVPDIENYVYGQSIEDLQQRIDRLSGSWLFADYGEFTMRDDHGSADVAQRLAVTVAVKLRSNADMMERMIASDRALAMVSQVYAHMVADCEKGTIEWISREDVLKGEAVPFVSTELGSYGWTLLINASAPDTLGVHALSKTYRNVLT